MSDVCLIEYEEQGTWALGLELSQRDAHLKAQYIDNQGREVRIHPQRIVRRYACTIRILNEASFLASLEREVQDLQQQIDLSTLWELFYGQEDNLSLDTFCELALGRTDLAAQVSVFRALRENPAYFRINRDDTLVPREPEAVRAMILQQEREQENRIKRTQFVESMIHAVQNTQHIHRREVDAGLFDLLRQFALSDGQEGPWQNIASLTAQIAHACGIPETPGWAAAFEILQKTGTFGPLDCPAVCALSPPKTFPEEALCQAATITPTSRVTTESSVIVTIDDEETLDIDDALEITKLPDGTFRLQIHISDPGRGVPAGSALELEARRRATSIYLPTCRVPMLPETLSENTFSLIAGQPREVISYIATIAPGGRITNTQVRLQTIVVSHRLTYDTVDAVLAGKMSLGPAVDEVLLHLFSVTQVLRQVRLEQGAVEIRVPEAKVRVDPNGEIRVKVIDADSPSRHLVSECMILANTMAGVLAKEHHLAVLYRIQKPPEMPAYPTRENSGVIQWARKLKKGELSCYPGPHYGLGVDVYVQASSPLRRYADLLATHQIRAFFLGEKPPFAPDDLMLILGNAEAVAEETSRVERKSTRYWLLMALSRMPSPIQAQIVESRGHRAQVLIEKLALRLPIVTPQTVVPGEYVSFDVKTVDPLRDVVVVDHVHIL